MNGVVAPGVRRRVRRASRSKACFCSPSFALRSRWSCSAVVGALVGFAVVGALVGAVVGAVGAVVGALRRYSSTTLLRRLEVSASTTSS